MFSTNKHQLLFLFGFLLAFIKPTVQNVCMTPSNQTGRCIKAVDCSVYKKAYDQHFTTNVEYFRQLQCGYNGTFAAVCCPNSGDYVITAIDVPKKKRYRPKKPTTDLETRFTDFDLPGKDVCGFQEITDRVFGGEIAEIDEFPWTALLFYKRLDQIYKFACGGTLIHSSFVLTAAHCVSGPDYDRIGGLDKVRLGEYNVEHPEDCIIVSREEEDCADPHVDVEPKTITLHPNYHKTNRQQYNDIALIKLKRSVSFSAFITPICLPDQDIFPEFEPKIGKSMFVAGWGRTELGKYSPVKLKVKVPLFNHSQCRTEYRRLGFNLTKTQICAGGEFGKDSCKGDSGGSLMAVDTKSGNWITCGIVSFGPSTCGATSVPGVYTNVKEYVPWIKATINEQVQY